jgi:small subunit ribosomal protein S18
MAVAKKKVCPIDEAGVTHIDYKDTVFLKKFLTKFNRIIPRYYSGTSLRNQKKLAVAVKRARYMALLPYVLEVRVSSAPTTMVATPRAVELDENTAAV